MRIIPSICLALALTGCPTPPDGGTQGGPTNAPPAGGGAPPPPPGAGADGAQPVESPPEADPSSASGTYVVTQLPGDDVAPPEGSQPTSEQAQAAIKATDHVIFTGEIKCADCSGNMLVKVSPFVQPTEGDPSGAGQAIEPAGETDFKPPSFETSAGPFTMAVPRYKGKVVLEVLDDRDGNGHPSRGEKFTVLHNQGEITAGKNQSGLVIDFSGLPGAPGGAPGGGPTGGPPPQ